MIHPSVEIPTGNKKRTMLYNKVSSCPDMEPEFLDIYEKCREYTMTSLERMYALYKAIEYIERAGIKGDYVECGVWRGGSAMLCVLTLQHLDITGRTIHLIDTFTGMTEPTNRDCDYNGDHASTRLNDAVSAFDQMGCVSLEEVQENLRSTGYPGECLVFVKGEVEKTIPIHAPSKIAMLRLDTDWYASTKHEMTHLYPRLNSGGVLIIDDYGHWRGAREAVDEYLQEMNNSILLNRIDYTGRIGIKP